MQRKIRLRNCYSIVWSTRVTVYREVIAVTAAISPIWATSAA